MSERWSSMDRSGSDGSAEPLVALRALDPATDDPNYWLRFQTWVVDAAGPELARRRLMARVTVGDVMSSWARALVPAALAAAAAAGILLVREPATPPPAPLSVEELLVAGLDEGEPIPTMEASAVMFASEAF